MAAIRASRHFAHSERLCTFLDYVVERVLAGNGGGLKEHDLGVAVFRRPESYDPQIDPTVRVEARRLRAKLAAYYSDEGRQEPILIHLPKGGYVPTFARRPVRKGQRKVLVTAALVALACVGIYLFRYMERRAHASSHHAVPPAAQDLYVQARRLAEKRTVEDLDQSVTYFQNAIALDPAYAAAYAGMACSYVVAASHRELPDLVRLDRARAAAQKALALDPNQAEAHASLGLIHFLYDWDFAAAKRELDLAVRLEPTNPQTLHWHSEVLFMEARHEEGLAEVRRALQLEPASLSLNSYAGFILYGMGRYDEAIGQLRKTLEIKSYWKLHRNLGWAYEQKGMYKEALAEHRLAVKGSGGLPEAQAGLAEALARSGRRAEARALLTRLQAPSSQPELSPYEVAAVEVALGDYDRAMDSLERAYQERSTYLPILGADPRFEAVRGQPRLRAILSGIGSPRLPNQAHGAQRK